MQLKRYFVFCYFYFILSNPVFSQSYSFRHYTVEDGLSSSTVYWSLLDKKGFIWFGTEAGVTLFDGTTFKQFSIKNGLSDNEVLKIFEDSENRIWFLTFNGKPSYYLNGKFHNPENDSILKKAISLSHFHSFFEDSKGNLWFGTIKGDAMKISGDTVTKIKLAQHYGSKGQWINFFEDQNQTVQIVNGYDWYPQLNGVLQNKFRIEKPLNNFLLFNERPGKTYFLRGDTAAAIFLFENGREKEIINQGFLPKLEFINTINSKDKSIWVSTNGYGCYFFNDNTNIAAPEIFLENKTINSAMKDHEGNMWFNTAGEGVYMLSANYRSIKNYSTAQGLSEDKTYSVARDYEGGIWIGFSNGTVNRLFKNTVSAFDISFNNSHYQRVLKIVCDSSGSAWCATDRGVTLLKRKKENRYQTIPINYPGGTYASKSVYLSGNNNVIVPYFIGVLGGDYNATNSLDIIKGTDSIRTYAAFTDHNGVMWVSTIKGLYSLQNGTRHYFNDKKSALENKKIIAIKEWKDSVLVLATDGSGILFFKNGTVVASITENEGLNSNICRALFVNKDKIWTATNKGIGLIEFTNNNFKVHTYSTSDGILSNEVRDVYADDSCLYAATSKGLSIIDYRNRSALELPPKVYISNITAGSQVFESFNDLKFDYKLQSLQVNFIAVVYRDQSRLLYRYKLNESEEWNETKNNQVEFYSLKPGKYKFSVSAKKLNSEWSEPTLIKFDISPPFWKTAWFLSLLAATVLFCLVFFIRKYSQRKVKRQLLKLRHAQELEMERSRISSDMHDDLGSDLTRISMWSRVIGEKDQQESVVKEYSQKIKLTSMDILEKMDEIIWALNPSNDRLGNLLSYLHNYSMEYFEKSPVNCQIKLDENIPDKPVSAVQRRNIFLLVKESLNNIMKHSNATVVNIHLSTDDKNIRLVIKDNGEGIKATGTNNGHGIINMKNRLNHVKGTLEILSDNSNGTELRFSIPFY